jgi:hypothetical protein
MILRKLRLFYALVLIALFNPAVAGINSIS